MKERVLEDAAADVIEASAADEAVRLIEREQPDVLVSDIGMPDTDGLPNAWSKLCRSFAIVGEPNASTIATVAPWLFRPVRL